MPKVAPPIGVFFEDIIYTHKTSEFRRIDKHSNVLL